MKNKKIILPAVVTAPFLAITLTVSSCKHNIPDKEKELFKQDADVKILNNKKDGRLL